MKAENRWRMTEQEKEQLIDLLTPELPVLRKKAKISQDDLSNLLGVSRQTYGAIERRSRRMTWNTYLSIILFYDKNPNTHELIRSLGVYPQEMIARFNPGGEAPYIELSGFLPEGMGDLRGKLDEQALHTVRSMILVEYARCAGVPVEAVFSAFDGVKLGSTAAAPAKKRARRKRS